MASKSRPLYLGKKSPVRPPANVVLTHTRRVLKFAQYENRAHNFFAVDRVPDNAKWGAGKHINELTLNDKPIYVWIVGVVATSKLYDHEKQADPANVSIEVDPVSSTVLAKAKHFLGRVCNGTRF